MRPPGDVLTTSEYLDEPPSGAALTAYDQANVKLYLRLLDADAQGAAWTEVVETLFGISANDEPERAARVHGSHLARARWMTQSGFAGLLADRTH
jgi:hypothetical protein